MLHGALAHLDVAELWVKGRLVKVPEAAVDFAAIAPEPVPYRSAPGRAVAGAEEGAGP
ncbi:hypothetical protein [Streptomyces sp. NPDC000410]|uniref:hypothetical protein n=1 Tax=Streptomyces sp. NPDC000410 TaxID=3154254 RepID=UPI0033323480